MSVIPRIPETTDRTGWRYRSRRRGHVWIITGGSSHGWHLYPDWPGAYVGTAGGTKMLSRSGHVLDDTRKWERVDPGAHDGAHA